MTTKLTLTIEEEVIVSAKRYAQKNGKSLSHLVENYLKSISHYDSKNLAISPKVSKLMGILYLPENFDYKKELKNAIFKKHGK